MEMDPMGATTFRIAGAIITITCIFYSTILRNKKSVRARFFMMLLYITLVDTIAGMISTFAYSSSLPYRARYVICYCMKFSYYLTHFATVVVFFYYMIYVCDVMYKYSKLSRKLILVPLIILEVGLLSNPFTHLMFSVSEDIVFTRQVGIYVAYLVSLIYFINCIVMLLKYWTTVNYLKKAAMAYFLILTFIGILVQMIFPVIVCELLCESIGLMGLMIMIEKEDDRLDYATKAYNKIALLQDLNSMIGVKRPFKIICIRIDNAELYRRITGVDSFDKILIEIVSVIMAIDEYLNIYRNGDANFYIFLPEASDEKVNEIAQKLSDRFEEGFITDKGETKINASILIASYPEEFKYADDIVLLSEAPITLKDNKKIIKGEDLEFLLRNIEVEKAISMGISDNKFHVFYQPIYDKECGCIRAAQALLKLQDDELGEVNFREFMPIAERAGFAEELEIRMIESIISFLGNEVKQENMNIDFVMIHVMAAKVLNKRLVSTVEELLEKYNVDPKIVAFDISDTMAEIAEENLQYVVNAFYDAGIKLFLGNYESNGSGVTLDAMEKFDGVILSAWRFLDPGMVEQGDIIMKARTDMLMQLGKKILIGGVDNKSYFDKIMDVNADYMSGKYFSEPITKAQLQEKFQDYDRVVLGDPDDI